nr:hypothetical protein [Tanacetum cinerariifolium]
ADLFDVGDHRGGAPAFRLEQDGDERLQDQADETEQLQGVVPDDFDSRPDSRQ